MTKKWGLIGVVTFSMYVVREIKNNRMSVEEAKESKYKNVLTQCIGVNEGVEVLFYRGKALVDELFIACSDGFRHFLSDIDLYNLFYDVCDSQDENEWDERLKRITEENMEKGEKDNISSILLKLSKQTL